MIRSIKAWATRGQILLKPGETSVESTVHFSPQQMEMWKKVIKVMSSFVAKYNA